MKADNYNVDDFSSSTSPMRGHVGLTESVWGKIRSRRRRNNCAKLCRHPLLTRVVLVMVAVEGHLNNCGWPIQGGSRSKPNFEFSPPLL